MKICNNLVVLMMHVDTNNLCSEDMKYISIHQSSCPLTCSELGGGGSVPPLPPLFCDRLRY